VLHPRRLRVEVSPQRRRDPDAHPALTDSLRDATILVPRTEPRMRPDHPLHRPTKRNTSLAVVALSTCMAAACANAPRVVQDFPPKAHRIAGPDVRFEWHLENIQGEEFVGYQLQVAPDEHFDKPEFDQVVEAPPVKLPLNPGRWFWRVRGRYRTVGDRIRETAWSDIQLVGGRYVARRMSFEALPITAPVAPAAAPAASTPGRVGLRRRARSRGGRDEVPRWSPRMLSARRWRGSTSCRSPRCTSRGTRTRH